MKIALAQIHPTKGDIPTNIEKHKQFIDLANKQQADAVFFSELSLTGYEPNLAKALAFQVDDERLNTFQEISNDHSITIGLGLPTHATNGIHISMAIFQPNTTTIFYHKQQLHEDELPYFINGNQQVVIEIEKQKITPAICYESLRMDHAAHAASLGSTIYLASVAKPQGGLEKAMVHYPKIAQRYQLPVMMVNCIGYCDNFESVGQTGIWNSKGKLLAQLGKQEEGILVF